MQMQDACICGDIKQVKDLVKKGFDVNTILDEAKTALCWSAEKGHLELSKYLLEQDADANYQEEDEGESVLIFVIQELSGKAMTNMVDLLIDHGAKVDLADFVTWTPLIHATTYKSVETVKVLLKHGADPKYKVSDEDDSALSICEDEIIRKLLESVD